MWFGFILGEIISGLVLSNAQTVLADGQAIGTNTYGTVLLNADGDADTCDFIGSSKPDEQVEGCPTKIPLIRGKTLNAARIYLGAGNDVPSLACNGGCQDSAAETKFTAPGNQRFTMGSVIVNPGCTMYVFSDYNYKGTVKKFVAGLYPNLCGGVGCAPSMLFTCQQVLPSCTPSSAWQTVATLDNTDSTIPTEFSYEKTIGTKFSEAMTASFGTSVTVKEELEESFYGLFKESTSISATIDFNWKTMDTEETSTDKSYTVHVTLPAGLKVFIEEVVGTCDGSKIHTQMFRVVDSHTKDTLHIFTGKMSNFVVNTEKMYSMASTLANGLGSGVETGLGNCCPKKKIWGNLNPDKNGIYLNVGRRQADEIPKECNSPCVYVKQDSLKNVEYCFSDSWTSQSQCETMDYGSGSGSNVG